MNIQVYIKLQKKIRIKWEHSQLTTLKKKVRINLYNFRYYVLNTGGDSDDALVWTDELPAEFQQPPSSVTVKY